MTFPATDLPDSRQGSLLAEPSPSTTKSIRVPGSLRLRLDVIRALGDR